MRKILSITWLILTWSSFCIAQTISAHADIAVLNEGQSQIIYILNNDHGVSGGVKSLAVIQQPEYGNTELVGGNAIKYISKPGYLGEDEFVYKVCNTEGDCDEAMVSIRIMDFDFTPRANNDTVFLKPDQISELQVLENDEELFDTPIVTSIVIDVKNGYSNITEDGVLTTNFNSNFRGRDSLLYAVTDKEGDLDEGWVMFQIKGDLKKDIFIPQGISPNGDGLNDIFIIPDLQGLPLKVKIFDVRGNMVYANGNYKNNWNGEANKGNLAGDICKNGTYYFVLDVPNYNREFTGFIYINR